MDKDDVSFLVVRRNDPVAQRRLRKDRADLIVEEGGRKREIAVFAEPCRLLEHDARGQV